MSRVEIIKRGEIRVDDPDNCYNYEVSGNCPVQGFGKVLDRELYFRARHEHWWFEVADHEGGFPSDGASGFFIEGAYPDAGWMPVHEAAKIMDRCLKEYLGLKSKLSN